MLPSPDTVWRLAAAVVTLFLLREVIRGEFPRKDEPDAVPKPETAPVHVGEASEDRGQVGA